MNIKQNINYFKRSGSTRIVGIALVILGFILFYFGWGWISYIIMTASIPAGAVLFIIGSSGRSDESVIDTCIEECTKGLEVELEANIKYKNRIQKHIPPETIEGYEYTEGSMLRYAKNGSLRSSDYTKAIIYTLTDAICISARTISVISDEAKSFFVEIPFSSIKTFEIQQIDKSLTFMKKSFSVRPFRLVIEYDGGICLSLPINNSINSDRLVERINKEIKIATTQDRTE